MTNTKTCSFCTVITGDYLPIVLAQYESLTRFCSEVKYYVFISDSDHSKIDLIRDVKGIIVLTENDLINTHPLYMGLKQKYFQNYHNEFRWSLKPVILHCILEKYNEKVIYIDSDLYFFAEYQFLFDLLSSYKILLSPHWRSSDPFVDPSGFELNFRDGIFNAGFIGVNIGAQPILVYLMKCCLYKCEVDFSRGLFDDQKYLDILPSRYEEVGILRHKGCNVGNWNQVDCKRVLQPDGSVLINNLFEIVFIHFTTSTIRGILFGNDSYLKDYLKQYNNHLIALGMHDIVEHHTIKFNKLKRRPLILKRFFRLIKAVKKMRK